MQKIDTQLPPRPRTASTDDDPPSVIHAPWGFKNFEESKSNQASPTYQSESTTVVSPTTPEAIPKPDEKVKSSLKRMYDPSKV